MRYSSLQKGFAGKSLVALGGALSSFHPRKSIAISIVRI